jgi:hypothetical protein
MNVLTATQTGISTVISQLQKQKEELAHMYDAAIKNGEKFHDVKILYMSLMDIDKKLNDMMRVCF